MKIMKSYIISNRVIGHERKPDRSALGVVYRLEGRYLFTQMFWTEQSLYKHYLQWSWINWMYLDKHMTFIDYFKEHNNFAANFQSFLVVLTTSSFCLLS